MSIRRMLRFSLFLLAAGFTVHSGHFFCRILQAHANRPYRFYSVLQSEISGAGDKERARRFEKALEAYRDSVSCDPRDPKNRLEVGRLCLHLSGLRKDQSSALLAEAVESLEKALQEMPAFGDAWFYLAQAYRSQGRFQEAGRAMAAAQMLAPHELALAKEMAAHWVACRSKHPEDVVLALLADRLLFLNRMKFERYGRNSLRIWSALSRDSPWGAILPKEDRCALAAARFYLDDEIHRDETRASEMFEHLTSPQFLPERHWIRADRQLRLGEAQSAAESYAHAVRSAEPEERERIARKAGMVLIQAGRPEEAMKLLGKTGQDSRDNRAALAEAALAAGFWKEILPFLEAGDRNPHEEFLLSRCHERAGDLARAIGCAEKAATRDPGAERYAVQYCRLLLSANMENSAVLYLTSYGNRLSRPAVFYDMLARKLSSRKDWIGARNWAEKAVNEEPGNENFRNSLSRIHLRASE